MKILHTVSPTSGVLVTCNLLCMSLTTYIDFMARLNNIALHGLSIKQILPVLAYSDMSDAVWVRILLPFLRRLLSFRSRSNLKNFFIKPLIDPFAHSVNQTFGHHVSDPVLRVEKIA